MRLRGNVKGGVRENEDRIRRQAREGRRTDREREIAYKEDIKEMKAKVESERALLMDSDRAQRERAKARMDGLRAIKTSLDAVGIKNYTRFFDDNEMADLGIK